jgi:hypothetical protein
VVVLMFLLVKIMCALFILCERFKVLCERLIITRDYYDHRFLTIIIY